jgi:uncharacterized protein YbjT (DUF2867 family)
MPVLVTGGTGTVGRLVVARLRAARREVRALSRHPGPAADGIEPVVADLSSGDGLAAALQGVETVVHCAGSARGDDAKARVLVHAAAAAGVTHLVHVSVVGVDRIPIESRLDRAVFGYYGTKLAAEQVVLDSRIPCSLLRATQFHDLVWTLVRQLAKLPVVPVPAWSFQPVAAGEVADQLASLALGRPAGRVPDLCGPERYPFADLVRSYLRATSRRRLLLPVRLPGRAAQAFAAGANLATDAATRGTGTWEQFLADQLGDSLTGDA